MKYFRLIVIGLLMGAAEVVPGVSGGTIAFITGIYQRLINAIKQFTPALVLTLFRESIPKVWQQVDGLFLLFLVAGMGTGIVLFAGGISYMLQHHTIVIWSLFFGLVLASAFVVANQIEQKNLTTLLAAAAGAVFGVTITQLIPLELEPGPLTLFLGGSVAVCAWILPGISGSFILLILGLYAFVIDAIQVLDIYHLAFLGAGCAVGIVSFSHVLSRLLAHYQDVTLAVLMGFMLGSLVKLWPWKNTLSYLLRDDGRKIPLVEEPVTPQQYELLTGADPQILLAGAVALGGCLLVLLIDWLVIEDDESR